MDILLEFAEPTQYEIRVSGRLGEQGALWFAGMEIVVDETVQPIQTVVKGYIEDQAALHSLISRIRDLGLTLVSVNQVEQKEQNGSAKDVLEE